MKTDCVYEELLTEIEKVRPSWLPYTADECADILSYFFDAFEMFRGEQHPKVFDLAGIIQALPYTDEYYIGGEADIDTQYYPEMIDAYFQTNYKNCDYHINPFLSGRIRAIKLLEVLRQYE